MSDNIQCTKCGKTGIDPDTHSCLKDYLALKEHIIHCDACGASWYDDGFTSSCPQCEIARLTFDLETVMFDRDNQLEIAKELRAENAALNAEIAKIQYQLLESHGKEDGMSHAYHRMMADNAALREKVEKAIKWIEAAEGSGFISIGGLKQILTEK